MEELATVVCAVLSMTVLAATGFVAWAVSSDKRTEWVIRKIDQWRKK